MTQTDPAASTLFSAFRWSLAGELASRVGLPLALLILARVLVPEDFGVVAAGTMVVSFAQVVWGIGLGRAVVRERDEPAAAAVIAFWINFALGAAATLLLLTTADAIALAVFQDARAGPVLRAMSVSILLAAAASVPEALLQRAMKFRQLFRVQLAIGLLPVLIALPLAWWTQLGYWALVIGGIAGQAIGTVAAWQAAGWRPGGHRAYRDRAALLRFGAWSTLSALLGWGFYWADSLVVGIYLGAHDLGIYRTASHLTLTAFGVVFSPLLPVLYSHLSAVRENPERLRDTFDRTLRAIAVVAFPICFALAAAGAPIEALLLGERWQGIGQVIAVLALAHGLAWLVGANAEAYRAVGRPELETAVMAIGLLLYVPVYVLSVRAGLAEFVWARCGLTFWGIALHLYVARRAVGLHVGRWLAFAALAALASSPILLAAAIDWRGPPLAAALQLCGATLLFALLFGWLARTRGAGEFRLLASVLGRGSPKPQ
jgi:lipopolysaccharide exporter